MTNRTCVRCTKYLNSFSVGSLMSIILGICKPIEALTTDEEILGLAAATASYAPDGILTSVMGNVGMACQPFVTTQHSPNEEYLISGIDKTMLVFDGRLDNRAELLASLELSDRTISDSGILLMAFGRWGEGCFAKLVGDWAVVLWHHAKRTLYLARDHAGSRSLYYLRRRSALTWSTYLETLIALRSTDALDDAYVARYLSGSPIGSLTPYRGVYSVPPAHFVAICGSQVRVSEHWSPLKNNEILYRTDKEYEDQFLTLFRQAVERRSAIGDRIIGQLSGGMDSTAITCMSDLIRRSQGCPIGDLLDTVSYFSASEPDWNEVPFVAVTEARRGKVGIHLNVPSEDALFEPLDRGSRYLLPGVSKASITFQNQLQEATNHLRPRAILSGIGGDEVLGGVPTPLPELANSLVQLDLLRLIRQGLSWSIANRTPLLHLLSRISSGTMFRSARRIKDLLLPGRVSCSRGTWKRKSTRSRSRNG